MTVNRKSILSIPTTSQPASLTGCSLAPESPPHSGEDALSFVLGTSHSCRLTLYAAKDSDLR